MENTSYFIPSLPHHHGKYVIKLDGAEKVIFTTFRQNEDCEQNTTQY
jgi:hypothetical protein